MDKKTKKGISIRVFKSMQEESDEVDDETFKKTAEKLMKKKGSLWKSLADK